MFPAAATSYEKPLEELKRLADTGGARVKKSLFQKRAKVHPTTFVGPGMVERVGEAAQEVGAELLIADNDLSPAQAWKEARQLWEEDGPDGPDGGSGGPDA